MCCTAPGQAADPAQLEALTPAVRWLEALSIGTAAAMLREAGEWSLDGAAKRFDADDWWFRRRFAATEHDDDRPIVLGLDGLATIAEVWLNGELLLQSDNMYLAHRIDVRSRLRPVNELLICCRALDGALARRRPRPRWRAPMVEHQQLRWHRATVLGRTPGWSPPAAAVGPWRDVWLDRSTSASVDELALDARFDGSTGCLTASCRIEASPAAVAAVELVALRDGQRWAQTLDVAPDGSHRGCLRIDAVDLWWPHTHGEPALYDARLEMTFVDGSRCVATLGPVGFRSLVLDTTGGRFAIVVNGVRVFCRGACWTPLDIVSLGASQEDYRRTLDRVRHAGLNMLRVGGMTVYEADAFFDHCDRAGVMVWQDLMFANMDYPQGDPAFMASVEAEVRQQLQRWQAHPCMALVCGNSEVEQQAAMWGTAREAWEPRLFHEDVPRWVESVCPGLPYWPSSAHGGGIPHRLDSGSTSYFGVGAYLRPLEDARRSGLSFASECLAFANVPGESTLSRMPGGLGVRVHHPTWKARSPRDLGAGWDFDDVRDVYFSKLYRIDPLLLRYSNHERYLQLSRVLTGEIMAAAFGEWRRAGSGCGGALVWFLRDLWAGAGWGLLDDAGVPKAAYHGVRRACLPVAAWISDEGCDGLDVHLANDPAERLTGQLEIALYRADGVNVGRAKKAIDLAPHSLQTVRAVDEFETALDLSAAFRFSESEYAVIVATLRDDGGEIRAQAFHVPDGLSSRQHDDVGLAARGRHLDDGRCEILVSSRLWAQGVHFDVVGLEPDDEYFHLEPQGERRILLQPVSPSAAVPSSGSVMAINSRRAVTIEWVS